MVKNQDLQKELKEKVKEGVKPSDLKKLKRSKSDSDISQILPAPPLPQSVPLSKSQSNPLNDPKYPYTSLISQQEKITELEKETKAKSETIALLRKKIDSLEKVPPAPLLQDQLTEKQKEVESLREKLEEVNQKLTQTSQELSENDKDVERLEKEVSKLLEQLKEKENELSLAPFSSQPSEEDPELSELDQALIKRGKILRD